jgi:hypothetical protein
VRVCGPYPEQIVLNSLSIRLQPKELQSFNRSLKSAIWFGFAAKKRNDAKDDGLSLVVAGSWIFTADREQTRP